MDDYMRTLSIEKKMHNKTKQEKKKRTRGMYDDYEKGKRKKMILMTEQESHKAYR